MAVGGVRQLGAGERGDQEEECRARQMKVRDQRVDPAERVARTDEQVGPSRGGRRGRRPPAAGPLERADHRRAHRDDAAAAVPRAGDRVRRLRRDAAPLRLHDVVVDALGRHRPERAGAHMQGDRRPADTVFRQPPQVFIGEVKAGGRRGHRPAMPRVDGLVALPVGRIGRPVDVRRERDVTVLVDPRPRIAGDIEPDAPRPGWPGRDDGNPRRTGRLA